MLSLLLLLLRMGMGRRSVERDVEDWSLIQDGVYQVVVVLSYEKIPLASNIFIF